MILILSDPKTDAHVEAVASELSRRGEDFEVYNPAFYPISSTLSIAYEKQEIIPILYCEDRKIRLSHTKSVWFRRPGSFKLADTLKPEEARWLNSECNQLFRALWSNLDYALWVSKPENIRQASLKLTQLQLAKKLGFRIPHFLVTNDVERAKSFIKKYNRKGVIIKALGEPTIINRKEAATLYTHLLVPKDLKKLASVRFGPTFLQEFITKSLDVRVTVIGKSLFAAAIDPTGFEEARIDFRRAEIFDLSHYSIELPKNIKTACLQLVQQLGLQFGAIDLLLTPEGKYVFLEINPNGQWLWIEWTTGMPLTKSMCMLLISRRNSLKSI